MSNLTLPRMTYAHLSTLRDGKIAYATTITVRPGVVSVYQHGNLIAELGPHSVYIDKCGWDSSTTANRLRQILRDNGVPFSVRIRDYAMRLIQQCREGWQEQGTFSSALFTHDVVSGWSIA